MLIQIEVVTYRCVLMVWMISDLQMMIHVWRDGDWMELHKRAGYC